MDKKERERRETLIKTADALEELKKTRGWEYLKDYLFIRVKGMKNELAKIDLVKELSKASKIQGKIEGLNSVFNRMDNVIKQAQTIKKQKEME